ncbi:hypothetical protein Aduo_017417 [Ancylostoma duodenale]
MNSSYFLLAFLFGVTQLSQASYPYDGYYGDYPWLGYYGLPGHYPYVPFGYGFGYPHGYGLHSHYYHPRTAFRNVAASFHKEAGHRSETDMITPFVHKKA